MAHDEDDHLGRKLKKCSDHHEGDVAKGKRAGVRRALMWFYGYKPLREGRNRELVGRRCKRTALSKVQCARYDTTVGVPGRLPHQIVTSPKRVAVSCGYSKKSEKCDLKAASSTAKEAHKRSHHHKAIRGGSGLGRR